MALKLFFLLLFFLPCVHANGLGIDKCDSLSGATLEACLQQIQSKKWWEPLVGRLALATKAWPGPLRARFDPSLDRPAKVVLEKIDGQMSPMILLGKNADSFELLLTLNHELVHYVNVRDRMKDLADETKIKDCVTAYRLATLKDEIPAFMAELEFWKNAPPSFKAHFFSSHFDTKLLNKKGIDYETYYRELKKALVKNKKFILVRYVDLGEYPICVKNLI